MPCWSTLHEQVPLCVATVQLCDGVIDCPQSEDEWPLTCALLKNVSNISGRKTNLQYGMNLLLRAHAMLYRAVVVRYPHVYLSYDTSSLGRSYWGNIRR